MMGNLYGAWVAQYQATDNLMTLLFFFGVLMTSAYYLIDLLPLDDKQTRLIKAAQGGMIIMVILITVATPILMDAGLLNF